MKKVTLVAALFMIAAGTAVSGSEKGAHTIEVKKFGEIEMVFIAGGKFMMGSPAAERDRIDDETLHGETVASFWMARFELTKKEYRQVTGINPEFPEDDALPAILGWYEAVEFCNALSAKTGIAPYYKIEKREKDRNKQNNTWDWDRFDYTVTVLGGSGFRLPCEAEWEYACRAGARTRYFWGDEMDDRYCWYGGNSGLKAHQPGQKLPNQWGLCDMSGNMTEWCFDWYAGYACSPGKRRCESPVMFRVLRGGDFGSEAKWVRSASRSFADPLRGEGFEGIRVVRSGHLRAGMGSS